MLNLITYAIRKLLFVIQYKHRLHSCGKSVTFFGPIRIDGIQFISVGSRTSIQRESWLYAESKNGEATLKIGHGTVLGHNNHITAIQDVVIGNNVLTANNIYISDNYHGYEDINTPIVQQPVKFKGKVYIGDGSWLGENVCVIGVKIGKNCVIGANSVVTKDIPDFSIAVGSPAKVIKQYNHTTKDWQKV